MGEHAAYRVVAVDDQTRADFVDVDLLTWFDEIDPRDPEPGSVLDWSRCYAATSTGHPPFAGIYGSFDMRLTVPGPGTELRQVQMAGLTWVGVHPDHRRRGVLTAMLDHHFRDLRDRGEVLAGLHASETGIYGRFGYAVAAFDGLLSFGGGTDVTAPGIESGDVSTTLLTLDEEATRRRVYDLHLAVAPTTLGQATRTWRHASTAYTEHMADQRGSEPRRVLVAARDGADVGYAILRRTQKWSDGRPQGTLHCMELAAADHGVLLALVRRLAGFDLIGKVNVVGVPVDSPAIWWLGGPRSCLAHVYDGVWLRLVDVAAAMEQRGYAAACDLVLEVADDRCEWNVGRWRLTAGSDGSATCTRSEDEPEVAIDVRALGAMYTGGRRAGEVAAQGWARELRSGALAELGAAMTTLVAPHPGIAF